MRKQIITNLKRYISLVLVLTMVIPPNVTFAKADPNHNLCFVTVLPPAEVPEPMVGTTLEYDPYNYINVSNKFELIDIQPGTGGQAKTYQVWLKEDVDLGGTNEQLGTAVKIGNKYYIEADDIEGYSYSIDLKYDPLQINKKVSDKVSYINLFVGNLDYVKSKITTITLSQRSSSSSGSIKYPLQNNLKVVDLEQLAHLCGAEFKAEGNYLYVSPTLDPIASVYPLDNYLEINEGKTTAKVDVQLFAGSYNKTNNNAIHIEFKQTDGPTLSPSPNFDADKTTQTESTGEATYSDTRTITFSKAGTYEFSIKATDGVGRTSFTETASIVIFDPEQAGNSANNSSNIENLNKQYGIQNYRTPSGTPAICVPQREYFMFTTFYITFSQAPPAGVNAPAMGPVLYSIPGMSSLGLMQKVPWLYVPIPGWTPPPHSRKFILARIYVYRAMAPAYHKNSLSISQILDAIGVITGNTNFYSSNILNKINAEVTKYVSQFTTDKVMSQMLRAQLNAEIQQILVKNRVSPDPDDVRDGIYNIRILARAGWMVFPSPPWPIIPSNKVEVYSPMRQTFREVKHRDALGAAAASLMPVIGVMQSALEGAYEGKKGQEAYAYKNAFVSVLSNYGLINVNEAVLAQDLITKDYLSHINQANLSPQDLAALKAQQAQLDAKVKQDIITNILD